MKKSKKVLIIAIIAVAVVAIAIPAGMYIAGNYHYTDARIYEENWSINLPSGIEEEYSKKTPTSFHGDGERYTVFNLDNSNLDFTNDFSKGKDVEIEDEITEILSSLSVDSNHFPDFSHDYLWLSKEKEGGDKLFMVYDTILDRLYVIQQTV